MHKHTNNIKSLLQKINIINPNYNKIKNDITNDLNNLEKQYDITHLEQHYFLRKMIYAENIKLLTELDLLEKFYKANKLILTGTPIDEPGEKVKTFSSARLSEKSKDFLDNEPYQATLDKLGSLAMPKNEPVIQSDNDLSNKIDILISEYETYKENAIEHQQQLLDNNKLLLAEIDILNEKYTKMKEDYNNLLSDFDKVKTEFNSKNVHLNSLLVQKSLEVSKYKDKYDSLKIKSINRIKQLCNSNNEKIETINKLLTEQGEINC